MAEIVIKQAPYLGGAEPYVGSVHTYFNTTQMSFEGFTSDDATIRVRATGSTAWKTVTVDTTEYAVIVSGSIDKIEVSGLVAGDYKLSAIQWNS